MQADDLTPGMKLELDKLAKLTGEALSAVTSVMGGAGLPVGILGWAEAVGLIRKQLVAHLLQEAAAADPDDARPLSDFTNYADLVTTWLAYETGRRAMADGISLTLIPKDDI